MSTRLLTMAFDSTVSPAAKRLVLLALADTASDEGVCWPSIATLARKAGVSRRRTEEVLAELATDKIISKVQRWNNSNVYTISLDALAAVAIPPETPREIRGSRENQQVDPRDSRVLTREEVGPNRHGTKREPKDSAPDGASGSATPALQAVPETKGAGTQGQQDSRDWRLPGLTVNQVATRLAQDHYDRLGRMGNVPAWVKIIKKALEHDYPAETINTALTFISDRRWSITEERLANTLRGGPRPAGGPPPRTQHRTDPLAGVRPAGAQPFTPASPGPTGTRPAGARAPQAANIEVI